MKKLIIYIIAVLIISVCTAAIAYFIFQFDVRSTIVIFVSTLISTPFIDILNKYYEKK